MTAAPTRPMPLLKTLGRWHRPITTRSPEAQKYFDQGLRQLYGFEMQGAERSFRRAAELDSNCAACWWGVAMSLGPHINVPALPERTHAAYEAVQKAYGLRAGASEVERALIEALVKRYRDPQPTDPKEELEAETAYADAMREVHRRFPDDPDVGTLLAEAMMDLRPWDYWKADGTPQPGTEEIVAALERVLARHPDQPGANHLYIHALEASPHPEKAVPAADRLRGLMPGVGHMAHMPSHIYQRVGRYDDAALANRKAIQSDQVFRPFTGSQDFFTMYSAHNVHFLAYTMMIQGRSAEALENARRVRGMMPLEMLRQMPGFDLFLAEADMFLVQFGRFEEILKEPSPPADFPFLWGIRHWARGMAFAAKGALGEATVEAESLSAITHRIPPEAYEGFNSAQTLLGIAARVLAGRMAEERGNVGEAIRELEEAVRLEDGTRYDEPPDWPVHTRWMLGALLLDAGRAADAEAVYREDLRLHPGNGWALQGLVQSLRAQKKNAEATQAEAQSKKAWRQADVKLGRSER
jgi:tetratricopeptide (TPR) repeat protein